MCVCMCVCVCVCSVACVESVHVCVRMRMHTVHACPNCPCLSYRCWDHCETSGSPASLSMRPGQYPTSPSPGRFSCTRLE